MEFVLLDVVVVLPSFLAPKIDSLDGFKWFNNHVKTYKLAWFILSSKQISVEQEPWK